MSTVTRKVARIGL